MPANRLPLLYDLTGADDLRFSPYCWRIKMALRLKGLDFETEACRFGEIPIKVAFANHDRVPVLDDCGMVVADSWKIATYLEDAYQGAPTLFGGEAGRAYARYFNLWADMTVLPALAPAMIPQTFDIVDPIDRDYFRKSREARFGCSLEELGPRRGEAIERFHAVLQPARRLLGEQEYLAGPLPLYPDFVLMGCLMWPRLVSRERFLDQDDPIALWFDRMLDQYNGFARQAPERAMERAAAKD